jgi:hypothetical protein
MTATATKAAVDWRIVDGELKPFVVTEHRETIAAWAPQPGSQEAFLACPAEEVLYEGTRGPGKTDALLMDFCQYIGRGWGAEWRGIIFRQTFPQLSDIIVKSQKWFPLIWPGAKYNGSDHIWTWPDGENLRFSYGMREKDYWNYHGKEWPFLGFEELTTWADPSFFLKMFACNRSSKPGMPRKIRCTTNPYGPGHNWVKARYKLPVAPGEIYGPLIEEKDEDGEPMPERIAIHGYLDENQILLTADPKYKGKIRAAAKGNKAIIRAWLHGDWDIVAGGMFDDVWDAKRHVVPDFVVPKSWKIYRAFDWGSSKPFSVGWWAKSDGSDLTFPNGRCCSTVPGDLFRIAEWYGWNGEPNQGLKMINHDIARGIIERELAMGIHDRVKAGPADASIFKVENGTCYVNELMKPQYVQGKKRKIRFISSNSAPGTRKLGWGLMRERFLAVNPEKPRIGPREFPGIFIGARCEEFRRTVPVLSRDEKDPDDVDTDTEDHIGDESRYMVVYVSPRRGVGRTAGVAS